MNTLLETFSDYDKFLKQLKSCSTKEQIQMIRYLCRTDLYFLLWWGFGRNDVKNKWILERCREVQNSPNGYLDLWAREHYKSTIITYAKTIQDILASHGDDPLPSWKGTEPTFGIFSCTRPIAKGFLRQIKREFENNDLLRAMFPDVIWANCGKEAPKWSEDDGLVLKRKSNPKESTIEAWGLVDGQPTSKHFFGRIYDDMVTIDNVRSPAMIEKTTEAWELSINLGVDGGFARYIGTRYHFNDTYRTIMERQAAKPRIHAATIDGTVEGDPVLLTKDSLSTKRQYLGPYTFSTQMLLNPLADETQGFSKDWLKFWKGGNGDGMNIYILVDPANEKKKTSDYTAIEVVGMGADHNYYTLDLVRDRLNLTERGDILFQLHKKWQPLDVGYEKYGMQADIAYIQDKMNRENYRFNIKELKGKTSKIDRIKQLIPIFEQSRWYLPNSCFKTNYEGKTEDLVDIFIHQEYLAFPVPIHDDMLDVKSRILDPDLGALWPKPYQQEKETRYASKKIKNYGSGWAA